MYPDAPPPHQKKKQIREAPGNLPNGQTKCLLLLISSSSGCQPLGAAKTVARLSSAGLYFQVNALTRDGGRSRPNPPFSLLLTRVQALVVCEWRGWASWGFHLASGAKRATFTLLPNDSWTGLSESPRHRRGGPSLEETRQGKNGEVLPQLGFARRNLTGLGLYQDQGSEKSNAGIVSLTLQPAPGHGFLESQPQSVSPPPTPSLPEVRKLRSYRKSPAWSELTPQAGVQTTKRASGHPH